MKRTTRNYSRPHSSGNALPAARPRARGKSQFVSSLPTRTGAMLVVVLVCLLLCALISGALLKGTLLLSRQAHIEQQRAQVEWLGTSALSRAAARLRADPAYAGETWEIPPSVLGGGDTARV